MQRDIVIGIEVHIQLNTNSKLFCGCDTREGVPNSHTCPTCLGHPGSKPRVNKRAVEFAVRMALALECTISPTLVFSRKTYFYPDMAKNYQITQYETPLATNGRIVVGDDVVRIKRLHLEEDPAAMVHAHNLSLVDYNRSGIPLIEIVTEPDLHSPEQARAFMKKLQSILAYLDIFDKGIIKADVNVSVKSSGYQRVEIKNITGFKEIERAIVYEVSRQQKEDVRRETRAWHAEHGRTLPLRTKETEEDYGYITDPDIVVRPLPEPYIEAIQKSLPELPEAKVLRWINTFKIDNVDATILAADPEIASLYEEVAQNHDKSLVARWFRRELLRSLNNLGRLLRETPLRAHHLTPFFELLESKTITDRVGQTLFRELVEKPFDVVARVREESLSVVSDETSLATIIDRVLSENAKALSDYKKGEVKAFEFLVGQVMRSTKGKARPDVIRKILKEKIA